MPELLFDKRDNVGIITLNRPDHLNALTFAMAKDLISYFQDAELDDSIRAIILTGAGRAFCSGADLASGTAGRDDALTPMGMKLSVAVYERVYFSMANCEKPVVTAINGTAAGAGLNIGLGGDIIVAVEGAKLIEVFVRRGLVPDAGGCFLLPRMVGLARAKEIMLFGDDLLAERALEIGLIHRVVPKDKLMDEAMALAGRLAAGPTRAIGMIKKMLNRSFDTDMQTMLEFESAYQGIVVSTDDVKEGIASFLEKRPPKFQGK
jgi:2-(1,2-epoxy-1,2-dihydrophenyl)acetyl-CoA isomerase